MNVIADTWRGLVRRRLWPLAVVLLAALVAVPLLLAKQPTPAAPPAPVSTGKAEDAATESLVSLAGAPADGERRRVLGESKDPFAPKPEPKAKHNKKKSKAADAVKPAETPAATSPAPPPAPAPPAGAPPAPKPSYPQYSLKVRFGRTDGTMRTSTIAPDQALPSASNPVLVYVGPADGGKAAVFLIEGDVTANGDGKCDPSPEECTTLTLRAGETEFIDVATGGGGTQYELDLETIHAHKTTSALKAKASSASLREKLRAARVPYRFDTKTGTLRRTRH